MTERSEPTELTVTPEKAGQNTWVFGNAPKTDHPTVRFKLIADLIFTTLVDVSGIGPDFQVQTLSDYGGGIGIEVGASFVLLEAELKIFNSGFRIVKISDPDYIIDRTNSAAILNALVKLKPFRAASPFICAGGYVGFALSPLYTSSLNAGGDIMEDSEEQTSFMYGLIFGAGFEMDMGSITWEMECRYYMGLSRFLEETVYPGGKERLKGIVLSLSIKF